MVLTAKNATDPRPHMFNTIPITRAQRLQNISPIFHPYQENVNWMPAQFVIQEITRYRCNPLFVLNPVTHFPNISQPGAAQGLRPALMFMATSSNCWHKVHVSGKPVHLTVPAVTTRMLMLQVTSRLIQPFAAAVIKTYRIHL